MKKNDQRYLIRIKNWDNYQREMRGGEKRRRRREWIAISVDLFSDPDFLELDHTHSRLWLGLLLHAGKVGPEFSLTPARAVSMFCLRRPCDFSVLEKHGFIDLEAATNKTDKQTDKSLPSVAVEPTKKAVARTSNRFAEFWDLYPNKTGKKPCLAKWKARRLDHLADEIIQNVRDRIERDSQWKDGFIPNPMTYINQDRWSDPVQENTNEKTQRARPESFDDKLKRLQRRADGSDGSVT